VSLVDGAQAHRIAANAFISAEIALVSVRR
jgi:hypothetical protein